MFVFVVASKTYDVGLGSAVERGTVEVVGRVMTDADDRGGIGLPDVLDGGGPIRFTSGVVSLPEALVNLLCISEKRLSVSVFPSLRLKLKTSYTQSDSGVGGDRTLRTWRSSGPRKCYGKS